MRFRTGKSLVSIVRRVKRAVPEVMTARAFVCSVSMRISSAGSLRMTSVRYFPGSTAVPAACTSAGMVTIKPSS